MPVNCSAAIDTTELMRSQTNILVRGDLMFSSAGGDAGSIRFPISIPTRNIDRYPDVSFAIVASTKEREYPFPVLIE